MDTLTTPVAARGRRSKATPLGSAAKRTPLSTPRSTLTPNDDAAERATARKRRAAERMRKSLAGTFDGADASAAGGAAAAAAAAARMSDTELRTMLDLALKLAAENKITDRNVWALPLIDHLPDLVQRAAPDAGGGAGGGAGAPGDAGNTNYFTRISGGLDAGVQIYARRVDATWKLVFSQLHGGPVLEDGSQAPDGSQEGGVDAPRRRARRGGAEPREDDTLAAPEALRMKALDGSFMVDPLFHRMSQIFDEDGAQGMLLLNRGVCGGSAIMFESNGVPEDHFPLPLGPPAGGAAAGPVWRGGDATVNMTLLRPQLAALAQQRAAGPPAGAAASLAPATRELYALLEARGALEAVDDSKVEDEIAQIMTAVEADVVRYPAAGRAVAAPAASAAAGGGGGRAVAACSVDGDASMEDAEAGGGAELAAADGGEALSADAALAASEAEAAAAAVCAAETQRREAAEADECAKLAEQYAAAAAEDDGAGAGGDWDGGDDGGGWDAGGDDGSDAEGPGGGGDPGAGGGEDGSAAGAGESLLGAAGGLEDMLGASGLSGLLGLGGAAGRGAGWAGSSYWRSQKAPPGAGGAKRGGDGKGTKRSSKRPTDMFVDFEAPPELPPGALAEGSLKQTTLATSAPAHTLLPEDLRFEASSLARLFFKPHATLAAAAAAAAAPPPARPRNGADAPQQPLVDWGADLAAPGDAGGYAADAGDDDDDYGDGAGDCYGDAGDAGDWGNDYEAAAAAGSAAAGGGSGGGGRGVEGEGVEAAEMDPELRLLSAPRRAAAVGVSYSRASKQVDVHALKEIIWGGVRQADGQILSGGAKGGASSSGGEDAIDFRDVIKVVPQASAAGRLEDLSVHMCFICLLHLANQHGLEVKSGADLRTLTIRGVPQG